MDFSDALKAVKAGKKIQRKGWNGKGMWIEIQRPDKNSKMTLPYLYLNYPNGTRVPWLASQTDMLEEDWVVLEPERKKTIKFEAKDEDEFFDILHKMMREMLKD